MGSLRIKVLALRIWAGINEDDCWGTAAELAYYFLLAFFPMLIFVTNLVGFLPGAREGIISILFKVMPHDAMSLVDQTMADIVRNRGGGWISLGILGAIWAGSTGVSALISTLNITHDVRETRSYWRVRLIAIVLTVALSTMVVGGSALILFGNRLATWLIGPLGSGSIFHLALRIADSAIGILFVLAGIQIVYYFGPNVRREWRWVTPGSIFTAFSILAVSELLSIYLRVAPSYSVTYGGLGAVVVLMLWLYLIGFVILVGSEINVELGRLRGSQWSGRAPPDGPRAG
jgi:membrane protein